MSFGVLRETLLTGQFRLTLLGNFSTVPLVLRPTITLGCAGCAAQKSGSHAALGSQLSNGQVAQSVEHGTENPGVGSSILPLPTTKKGG
jgi:hypothetical protein